MKRVLSTVLTISLLLAMAMPGVATAAAKQPNTLWDAYPNVPSTIAMKGEKQFFVAYDTRNNEAIWMGTDSLQAFVTGADSIAEPGIVGIGDFSALPETVVVLIAGQETNSPPAAKDNCQWTIERSLTKGGWSGLGYYYYALLVEWTYNSCTNEVETIDPTAQHDSLCWNCTAETTSTGRISPQKMWGKGNWTFKYSCTGIPVRTISKFIKGTVNRWQMIWTWS